MQIKNAIARDGGPFHYYNLKEFSGIAIDSRAKQ